MHSRRGVPRCMHVAPCALAAGVRAAQGPHARTSTLYLTSPAKCRAAGSLNRPCFLPRLRSAPPTNQYLARTTTSCPHECFSHVNRKTKHKDPSPQPRSAQFDPIRSLSAPASDLNRPTPSMRFCKAKVARSGCGTMHAWAFLHLPRAGSSLSSHCWLLRCGRASPATLLNPSLRARSIASSLPGQWQWQWQ